MMQNRTIAALTMSGFLALGIGAPVLAQTSPSTPTTATPSAAKADHEARRAADRADLAARLGVSVAKLDEADKALALSDVDAALAAGRITAEQATVMKAAINSGTGFGRGGMGPGGRGGRGPRGQAGGTTTAKPTEAERTAAAEARLTRYLGFLGVTKEKFVAAVTGQAKARIDQAVTDGRLTAAQAAARKAVIDADVAAGQIPGGPGGHGHGGPGGPGGRGPGRGHR